MSITGMEKRKNTRHSYNRILPFRDVLSAPSRDNGGQTPVRVLERWAW